MYYLLQKKRTDSSASFKLRNFATVQPGIPEPWSETVGVLCGGCSLNRQYQEKKQSKSMCVSGCHSAISQLYETSLQKAKAIIWGISMS